jgi:very-short-patch-repair endonuclease
MSDITYFTKVQNTVEKWIEDMGLRVRSEVNVENYRADLVVPELEMIVEIDGPSHRKLKPEGNLVTKESNKISKRDKVLLEYYNNGVFHIPVDIEEEIFKKVFLNILEDFNG